MHQFKLINLLEEFKKIVQKENKEVYIHKAIGAVNHKLEVIINKLESIKSVTNN